MSDQQLDQEILEEDIHSLAQHIEMTPGLLGRLGLNRAEKCDATRKRDVEGTQAGVAHALRIWRRMDISRATYRPLVDIFIELKSGDTAADICRFIVEK